ncbi:VanZ family protein [Tessaracoccus rhinocerotis]|uniref:VanZ family protein n=2 Tax=Tessaracoccus rhinocerotis TaxID=1689449 RepID=A0A553JWG9_9ACTN|nr:VanZ family protein [Tessaracoccus rhinocerotis]
MLNVVLFAVPVMLLATMWPHVPRWLWLPLGVVASFCIEMVQGAFLPRTSSLLDWVANSLGALVGVASVLLLERFRPAPAAELS